MRLLFGAEPLLGPRSGVGRYAWHLFVGLQNYADEIDLQLAANGRMLSSGRLGSGLASSESNPQADIANRRNAATPPRASGARACRRIHLGADNLENH
jgi:hypothetical protein